VPVICLWLDGVPSCCLVLFELVKTFIIRFNILNTDYTVYFAPFVASCVKLDPDTHKGMHSVWALKLGVTYEVLFGVPTHHVGPMEDLHNGPILYLPWTWDSLNPEL
jgi:hypothetical protein